MGGSETGDGRVGGGDSRQPEFTPAHFVAELGLPPADAALLADASRAVREEFRDCSKWKRLRCRRFSVAADGDRGVLCAVYVGNSIEFDWTWEGAVAFRPQSLGDVEGYAGSGEYTEQLDWSGEILEVDERNGCLIISLLGGDSLPRRGAFFVRPFEFLAVLNAVYREPRFDLIRTDLASRLAAAEGGIHPGVAAASKVGLTALADWWRYSWSVLWGPPGTGKTFTTGQQIAAALDDPQERILVVSTTNRATDAAAVAVGTAAQDRCPQQLADGRLLRIGKGASYQTLEDHGLAAMCRGTEAELLSRIGKLAQQLKQLEAWEDKALTRKQISELRAAGTDQSKRLFVDPEVRVVITTAFKAMTYVDDEAVRKMIEQGEAPFTTLFIDESGLISRAAVAVLSLLASRRVVLVGDSKQLAPISRIARILPTRQEKWLASSGVSHLTDLSATPEAVRVLTEQRRMHPDVCRVVSQFQYAGRLRTAQETIDRESRLPACLANHSRAIWYVLDEEDVELSSIRAARGPGNKSWVREISAFVLQKLFADTDVRQAQGLYVAPYRAQALAIGKLLAAWGIDRWESSTVHSQQGSEAEIVIFDSVNAGSYNWPYDEWKRLVNVALSRAKEAVLVLASRSEMEEPYLRPLLEVLSPCVLDEREGTGTFHWRPVSVVPAQTGQHEQTRGRRQPRGGIGQRLSERKSLRPVLSQEQQRISNLELDGKPRLIRGVAGSGKSIVLANWLAKTARQRQGDAEYRIWAVYANRSLHKLLRQSIEAAWEEVTAGQLFDRTPFPWDNVSLLHVKDVLEKLLPDSDFSAAAYEFDYDAAAAELLSRQGADRLLPRCNALFIDEAQDMGPYMLRLLLSLVERSDAQDDNSRAAHIFYDNAQNIYGRNTPRWSEFGIDMRGRSLVLRESFRSTRPITEFAVNVLHRLSPAGVAQEHRELLAAGLLERVQRQGREWLKVRFNQIHGPQPMFRKFATVAEELDVIAVHLSHLISREGISPNDICMIYNVPATAELLLARLGPRLKEIGVELSVQRSRGYERRPNTLLVTTSHSFKGYDAEVLIIACADHFVLGTNRVLATSLYVAMTRARSLLAIYSLDSQNPAVRRLNDTLATCLAALDTPDVDGEVSHQDDINDVLELIGQQYRAWLTSIWRRCQVIQEPIIDKRGKIVAEPLLWFVWQGQRYALFAEEDTAQQSVECARQGIVVILPGDDLVQP